MGKQPLPAAPGHKHAHSDHPPLKPGSKNFVVEIRAHQKSVFISIPLHPNTDPHCFFWSRHDHKGYLVLREDTTTPDLGLHVLVTVKGVCVRIAQAPHPGDFQSE